MATYYFEDELDVLRNITANSLIHALRGLRYFGRVVKFMGASNTISELEFTYQPAGGTSVHWCNKCASYYCRTPTDGCRNTAIFELVDLEDNRQRQEQELGQEAELNILRAERTPPVYTPSWPPPSLDLDFSPRPVYNYSYKPTPNFLPSHKESWLYLGVELEIDDFSDVEAASRAIKEISKKETLFYLKEDGSLSTGFEVVTHPATLKYHKDKMPWPEIIKLAKEYGGRSHDTSSCGLHVHFNNTFFGKSEEEQDFNTLKLLFVVDKFWPELVKFSRREYDNLQRWAKKMNEKLTLDDEGMRTMKGFKEDTVEDSDKYQAINLINENTIEVRIFRGTLKHETILATLELVDFIAHFVKLYSTRLLYRMSWADFVEKIPKNRYGNLVEYLKEIKGGD